MSGEDTMNQNFPMGEDIEKIDHIMLSDERYDAWQRIKFRLRRVNMKRLEYQPTDPGARAAYKEAKAFVAKMEAEGAGKELIENKAIRERLEILLAFYIESKQKGWTA